MSDNLCRAVLSHWHGVIWLNREVRRAALKAWVAAWRDQREAQFIRQIKHNYGDILRNIAREVRRLHHDQANLCGDVSFMNEHQRSLAEARSAADRVKFIQQNLESRVLCNLRPPSYSLRRLLATWSHYMTRAQYATGTRHHHSRPTCINQVCACKDRFGSCLLTHHHQLFRGEVLVLRETNDFDAFHYTEYRPYFGAVQEWSRVCVLLQDVVGHMAFMCPLVTVRSAVKDYQDVVAALATAGEPQNPHVMRVNLLYANVRAFGHLTLLRPKIFPQLRRMNVLRVCVLGAFGLLPSYTMAYSTNRRTIHEGNYRKQPTTLELSQMHRFVAAFCDCANANPPENLAKKFNMHIWSFISIVITLGEKFPNFALFRRPEIAHFDNAGQLRQLIAFAKHSLTPQEALLKTDLHFAQNPRAPYQFVYLLLQRRRKRAAASNIPEYLLDRSEQPITYAAHCLIAQHGFTAEALQLVLEYLEDFGGRFCIDTAESAGYHNMLFTQPSSLV